MCGNNSAGQSWDIPVYLYDSLSTHFGAQITTTANLGVIDNEGTNRKIPPIVYRLHASTSPLQIEGNKYPVRSAGLIRGKVLIIRQGIGGYEFKIPAVVSISIPSDMA